MPSRCKGYAWNDHRGGTCWLKRNLDSMQHKSGVRLGVLGGQQGQGKKFFELFSFSAHFYPGKMSVALKRPWESARAGLELLNVLQFFEHIFTCATHGPRLQISLM